MCGLFVVCLHTQDTNTMIDLIYLIVLTPVTIAVMYGVHVVKRNAMRRVQTPEAKPYVFERDVFKPEFNDFTQMLVERKMYKGGSKL